MVEMQDTKNGIKGSEQKLNVTTIPHVISGETKIYKNINKTSRHIKNTRKNTFYKVHVFSVFTISMYSLTLCPIGCAKSKSYSHIYSNIGEVILHQCVTHFNM